MTKQLGFLFLVATTPGGKFLAPYENHYKVGTDGGERRGRGELQNPLKVARATEQWVREKGAGEWDNPHICWGSG